MLAGFYCCPGYIKCVDKRQLLIRLDKAWGEFQDSHAGLSPAQLIKPGVTGTWSVRDILAHVTTWEEEALKYLPVILRGETPPRYSAVYGGIHGFNAQMAEQKQALSLEEVLQQLSQTHYRLVAFITGVPDEQFRSETRFLRRLRLDTYGHYPKHSRAIWAWRQKQSNA